MTKMINALEIPMDIKCINAASIILYALFMLIVLYSSAHYWVASKANVLNKIIIKGNTTHNDATSIRNQLTSNLRGNFYNINLVNVKQSYESIAWVNKAVVRRVYPNNIEINVTEYKSKAIWGNREEFKFVDDAGTVFEASADEDDYGQMPQFMGPEWQSKLMLEMHDDLATIFATKKQKIKILELNLRGSWAVTLEGGARLELGQGKRVDIVKRLQVFTNGLDQMLVKLNKKVVDIEYADLRHTDGYALRMRGVITTDTSTTNIKVKK